MKITLDAIRKAAKHRVNVDNANSVIVSLDKYGAKVGLDQAHRVVHYLAQLMHESGSFKYDAEIWGPTPAQKRYERDFGQPFTKTNQRNKLAFTLGNSEKGDGKRFSGRTGMQLTGRGNYRRFTRWVRDNIDASAPDFEANPEMVNVDPWEGLVPIWFWTIGNSTGKSLNVYADQNNIEMITLRVNGGKNGLADRMDFYDRIGLTLLDYGFTPNEYERFQTNAKASGDYDGAIDGEAGPKTRTAIHKRLVRMTNKTELAPEVKEAPITVDNPVPVPVKELEKPWYKSPEVLIPTVTPVLPGLAGFDWRVMIVAIVVGAAFAGYLIYRRNNMKVNQAAKVEAIEARAL
jgi:putative chitinase